MSHTKRIDRNLSRKETNFVCYTSSVLRKSRHMKQKKKLRTVAKIKAQDYKNWWSVAAAVIVLNKRETADSNIWFIDLADKSMVRSYSTIWRIMTERL